MDGVRRILVDVAVNHDALARLREMPGVDVSLVEPEERVRPQPAELLRDVSYLFCTFPPQNLDELRCLEWVQITSAGYNQLHGLQLPARGVRATNARGCFDVPIAEWNVGMMVNLARNLRQ